MQSTSNIIELNQIRFAWDKKTPLITIPTFDVQAGEKLFLQGPSGCGKSTLLSLISGIYTPQQGTISVLNNELSSCNSSQRDAFRATHMGVIFQMFNLLPYLSLLDNVTLPCSFSSQRKTNALKNSPTLKQEAIRLLQHLELGDETLFHRPVTQLSIGQQQRAAAARALIGHPDIIIADEPTSSLDTDTRESFLQLLFSECNNENITLIFVSHDRSLQSMFDRTVEFNQINTMT